MNVSRYAQSLGLDIIDADYNHEAWRCTVQGLEGEPERGRTLSAMFQNAVTRYSTICSRKWIFCNYYHARFFTLEKLRAD